MVGRWLRGGGGDALTYIDRGGGTHFQYIYFLVPYTDLGLSVFSLALVIIAIMSNTP